MSASLKELNHRLKFCTISCYWVFLFGKALHYDYIHDKNIFCIFIFLSNCSILVLNKDKYNFLQLYKIRNFRLILVSLNEGFDKIKECERHCNSNNKMVIILLPWWPNSPWSTNSKVKKCSLTDKLAREAHDFFPVS